MPIVGEKRVTERAYAQSRERRLAAVEFAEACVHNGLGKASSKLNQGELLQLKAQIERSYLVALLSYPET